MKVIDAITIAKVKFATLFEVSYLDRKGNLKKWNLVTRGDRPKCLSGGLQIPDAAIIVPYHRREDKLVVIREYRVPLGEYQYGFPAGLLDPDETLDVAAKRELHEETGLHVVTVYRHSPAIFSSAGITDESIALVFVEVDGKPNLQQNSDSEEIELLMIDRHEVQTLLQRDDILFGARAWIVMDAFSRMGKAYLTGGPPLNF